MRPASAKAKGRKCRRCKNPFSEDIETRKICPDCRGTCCQCGSALTAETTYAGNARRKQYFCKSCVSANVKRTRGNAGFDQKAYDIQRLYGLTPAQHTELLNKASGCCQICKSTERLHIDHDHTTGKVRGILCSSCNVGLGYFKDSPLLLLKANRYLTEHLPNKQEEVNYEASLSEE